MSETPRHQCLIYDGSPEHQLPAIALMIQKKLNENFRCLYLNSALMVEQMRSCLEIMGVDVSKEIFKNRLVISSELVTAADGTFDSQQMLQKLEEAINQALEDGYVGLFATGDMTFEFGDEKNFSKLMDYEYGLENLFEIRKELSGICQYHVDTLPKGIASRALLTHQSIFINETLSRLSPHYSPLTSNFTDYSGANDALEEILTLSRKARGF
jgi:hypothetical protein